MLLPFIAIQGTPSSLFSQGYIQVTDIISGVILRGQYLCLTV